jgi:UDP-N-acetylmuramate dehydrogenase
MSINIEEQIALAPFTTMRVGGNARFFVRVGGAEELSEAVLWAQGKGLPIFVLGGGANTLVSQEGFDGLVIKIEMKGISYDGNRVKVDAGEWWDDVVRDIVAHDLWGVENLSLIPGTLGGAVVQNIGAYGAEIRNAISSVQALDVEKMQIKTFLQEECEFGYRESVFKKNNNLIVLSATLELERDANPNINYEDVKKYFENSNVSVPTPSEIREAIVAIRTAKMPASPLGSAGSFFKNPVVDMETYETLKMQFPEIKTYIQGDNSVKLLAAWLIDHVGGWRGYRKGDAGVHEKQALILVNYGNASAEEMISLASEIKKDIKEKTNVMLEEEVVMLRAH